jgi:hypothetical protein
VEWDSTKEYSYPVRIRVFSEDKKGMLAEISNSISSSEANITNARVDTTDDKKAIGTFEVEIRDLNHLRKVIKHIEKIKGVYRVERMRAERRGLWKHESAGSEMSLPQPSRQAGRCKHDRPPTLNEEGTPVPRGQMPACRQAGAFSSSCLGCLGDPPRPDAPGTKSHPSRPSLLDSLHFMKVRKGDFPGFVVRMTHIMAENRPFPADFTDSCHRQPSHPNLEYQINTASPDFQEVNGSASR